MTAADNFDPPESLQDVSLRGDARRRRGCLPRGSCCSARKVPLVLLLATASFALGLGTGFLLFHPGTLNAAPEIRLFGEAGNAASPLDAYRVIGNGEDDDEDRCRCPTLQCPAVKAECPEIDVICPPVRFECPEVDVECPVVRFECPKVECPAVVFDCPPVRVECPETRCVCPSPDALLSLDGATLSWEPDLFVASNDLFTAVFRSFRVVLSSDPTLASRACLERVKFLAERSLASMVADNTASRTFLPLNLAQLDGAVTTEVQETLAREAGFNGTCVVGAVEVGVPDVSNNTRFLLASPRMLFHLEKTWEVMKKIKKGLAGDDAAALQNFLKMFYSAAGSEPPKIESADGEVVLDLIAEREPEAPRAPPNDGHHTDPTQLTTPAPTNLTTPAPVQEDY